MNLAFYGTLRDADILRYVVGEALDDKYAGTVPVAGYACLRIAGQAYPLLRSDPDSVTSFDLYHDIPEDAWRRLVAYEGEEYLTGTLAISGREYKIFMAEEHIEASEDVWDLNIFQDRDKADYIQELS